MGAPCVGPDYVGRLATVPFGYFCDETSVGVWVCKVGAYGVEALGLWVFGGGLLCVLERCSWKIVRVEMLHTDMYVNASSSFF